jgi:hypothetical protein
MSIGWFFFLRPCGAGLYASPSPFVILRSVFRDEGSQRKDMLGRPFMY